jgi:hypothetical protein
MEILVWALVAGGLVVMFVVLPTFRHYQRKERWEVYRSHVNRLGPPDDDDDDDYSAPDFHNFQPDFDDDRPRRRRRKEPHITSLWMPTIVSLIVLIGCFTIILLPVTYGEDSAKFAFGAIGSVIGHWLSKAG